jgi:glycosyltransferase involved in cell wall biosynthesis
VNDPITLSVIVSTYNRSGSLGTTIKSLVAQTLPQSVGWEILVVDNNSNDKTREVVEELQQHHPERIRYLFEPHQGISYARNAGIQEACGEILAFIDDDETASEDWLQHLTANLHCGEWAGAGGRVLPPTPLLRPRWLLSKNSFLAGPLSSFDKGDKAGQLTEPPFGANMAFRREVFDKYGVFRTDLGRSGQNLLSNEDTEFGRRLMAGGERLRYEPSAITYHPVEEFRMHRRYFLIWWFNKGRSDVREFGNQDGFRRLFGIPLRLFRDVGIEAARWVVSFEPAERFICKLKVWAYAGQAYQAYLLWIEAKQAKREARFRPPLGDEK